MILVDYSQTSISTLMAELKGNTTAQINVPLIRHMIVNALRGYKSKFSYEYGPMVICCDDRRYWRKEAFPHYKVNRKKSRDSSGFDWSSIFEALNQIKQEVAEFLPYPVIEVSGAEADDVIASLVLWEHTKTFPESPTPIMILSGDHDFQQLQRYPDVKQYSPIEKRAVVAKGDIEELLREHIICGDRGDSIPNFLSPDDVFVSLSGERQKGIRKTNLAKWKTMQPEEYITDPVLLKNYRRNERLVDLRLVPLEIQTAAVDSYVLQRNARNRSRLLDYFTKNEMRNMIEHLSEF